ncbi:MAG TPA: CHAT domain-containing protein, partial [Caldilineaceae bacterium]|nr:CHAT domain-containing protein [Caldilineaceae bacterium]
MSPPAQYADIEIRILERQDEGYPIEITVNHEREFPRGYLDPGFLPWQTGADAGQDGDRLFNWLFQDETLRLAWAEVRGSQPACRIRLRIDAGAPELHALPWEMLQETRIQQTPVTLAAAMSTPFSRYLAGTWQPGGPILKRPLKILVVIPAPKNLAEAGLQPFVVEEEWDNLQGAMSSLVEHGQVELVRLTAPQAAGLRMRAREGGSVEIQSGSNPPYTLRALEEELKKGYHILHFIGHGSFNVQDGAALVVMANADNEVELVRDADFAAMLARQLADTGQQHDDKLRLVYLDSCASGSRDTANAFRGFAPALVQAGVPAVIAMQDQTEVRTSQLFSQTFYRQLLDHGLVDLACNEARSAVLSAQLPGAAIPVLFMRLRNGWLLGQSGAISSDRAETFWPFLLENINRGQCTPFLGPQVLTGLLPDRAAIAAKLAEKYSYPLADREDLARVAQ